MSEGIDEDEKCDREGCQGIIVLPPVENCICHVSTNPPCWRCTEPRLYCPVCGWEEANDLKLKTKGSY
jgi:hypothetical protein